MTGVQTCALPILALATGLLPGSPSLLLGLVPAIVGVLAIVLALAAGPVSHALGRRTQRVKIKALLHTVGDGVSEARSLLRSNPLAVTAGAAGTPVTSYAASSRLPLTWRAMDAMAVKLPGPPVTQASMQPSA